MSIVNHETGEITEPFTEAEATRLTNQVRLLLTSMLDQRDKVVGLIREARERRAYTAMGYPSWTAYVADQFADALPRLDRDDRVAMAVDLAEMGMSSRAIAPVLGVTDRQVRTDIAGGKSFPPVADATPRPNPEAQQAAQERIAARAPKAPEQKDLADLTPEDFVGPARPAVTGLDGKTYTLPEPKTKPVVLAGGAAEFDNAQQAAKSLARALSQLLSFEHSNMREGMRRYWRMASREVSPTQRADVTPDQMRAAARGLLALADEWDS